MTSMEETGSRSPFWTLWLSPGSTIERIVATRPRHLVLLLAILATIGGLFDQMASFAGAGPFAGLRFWLGLVVVGAVIGIVSLYVSALILNGIASLLGGRASTLTVRAALAWSGVPTILAFVIVLLIGALAGDSTPARGAIGLLVFVFGLWSAIIFIRMLARVAHFSGWRAVATYVLNLVVVLVLVILFRSFLFQPFNVPSHAMSPTLLEGDYFFAAKLPYGYTRYSLPFSPNLFSGRILPSMPERGDVVVFALPKDPTVVYVKRIVGLPGDRVQMKQGQLYLNDAPVKREAVADFVGADLCGPGSARPIKRWRETLPNDASYETLDCVENGFLDDTNVFTVPAGQFFVLGDNRDNSVDSRSLSALGYVPLDNLIGRVGLIFFSRDGSAAVARTERIGTMVR
jgi:signal peptidase I